jgi:hypothetical protein
METTEKKETRLEGFLTKDPQTHKAGNREFASFSIAYNTADGAVYKFCQVEKKEDHDALFSKALGLKSGEKVTIHGQYDSYVKNGKENEYVKVSGLDYHKKLEETVKIESISEIKPKEKSILNIQAKDKDGNFIKFSTYEDSPIYNKIKDAKLEAGDSIEIKADIEMRQVDDKTYQNGKILSLDQVHRKEQAVNEEKSEESKTETNLSSRTQDFLENPVTLDNTGISEDIKKDKDEETIVKNTTKNNEKSGGKTENNKSNKKKKDPGIEL